MIALPTVGATGVIIGADIAPAMLVGARDRLKDPLFYPVAADGQALPFKSGTFDAVICQLGLQSVNRRRKFTPDRRATMTPTALAQASRGGTQARCLKRQLSFPVSTISQ